MNSMQKLAMSYFIKDASDRLHPAAAAASGLLGPIGTALYERGAGIEPSDRWGVVGRSALGGAIGGGIGWIAGIPVSLATGVPILPTMAMGALGGGVGSAIGAWRGAKDHNEMLDRHRDEDPKAKKEKNEH